MSKNDVQCRMKWFKPKTNNKNSIPQSMKYYTNKWLSVRKSQVRPSTHKRNTQSINALLNVIDGKMNIKHFNLECIEEFEKIRSIEVKVSTLNIDLRCIKTLINWLLEHEYIEKKIKVKQHKAPKYPDKYISESNFIYLISNSSIPDWVKDACKVYWYTGCRKEELIQGTLYGNKLIIPAKLSKNNEEFTIPLERWAVIIVKDIQKRRDNFILKGNKLESFGAKLSKLVIDGFKEIGIYEKYRTKLHSLRHSFGCRMYLITADVKQVQLMMHHATQDSTDNYITYEKDDLLNDFSF